MGENVTRAIMFGTGIFITLLIASGVITIFSRVRDIYKQVDATNTNLVSQFGEYASYVNTEVTGLDVINAANKYYNKNLVVVDYLGRDVNNDEGIEYLNNLVDTGILKYEDLFLSTAQEEDYDGVTKMKITFTKK